jgi:hypothetical protein
MIQGMLENIWKLLQKQHYTVYTVIKWWFYLSRNKSIIYKTNFLFNYNVVISHSLSLFIFLHLTIYGSARLTNCYLSCYAETFRKCLQTFRMVAITSTSTSISHRRVQIRGAEILTKKTANLWQACPKWHEVMSPWHTAFTAVTILFISFARPACLWCEEDLLQTNICTACSTTIIKMFP